MLMDNVRKWYFWYVRIKRFSEGTDDFRLPLN